MSCDRALPRRTPLQLLKVLPLFFFLSTRSHVHASQENIATRAVSGLRAGIDSFFSVFKSESEVEIHPTRMQIQFVGLGRTGTASTAAAMKILGYKVIHDDATPLVSDLYRDLYSGKINEDELSEALGIRGYNASFVHSHYRWAGKSKNVKVVLTLSDNPDKWVDNWLVVARAIDIIQRAPFCWVQSIKNLMPLLIDVHKIDPTGGHPSGYLDWNTLRIGYDLHAAAVRKAVPKKRLLEYNVKQGWGPLCDFLKVPVPVTPFPHVNDRFKVRMAMMMCDIISRIWPLLALLPLGLMWCLLRYFFQGKIKAS